jgi:5-methylcytosine-specific restriction endonuclease McrA
MELQGTFWDYTVPTCRDNLKQFMRELGNEIPTRMKQQLWLASCGESAALLHDVLPLTDREELRQRWCRYLERISCESIARASRPQDEAGNPLEDNGRYAKRIRTPSWYLRYLKTEHMVIVKESATMILGSCVLCGSDIELQLHHRHYRTLGREQPRDVSLLCRDDHMRVHPWLGIRVPKVAPQIVLDILEREKR